MGSRTTILSAVLSSRAKGGAGWRSALRRACATAQFLGLSLFAAQAPLAASTAELPPVALQGESSAAREFKTVADLLAVLDVFEREKARYAPAAELRIRVLPRRDVGDSPALELRHGKLRQPIALDDLGRFTVEPAWRALPPDATVHSRLLDGRLAWMVDVRTPGLPEGSRRLGDLRLECRADLYGGALARGIKPPSFYALRALSDVCTSSRVSVGFLADRPVIAVQVREQGRRSELPYRWLHGSELGQSGLLFGFLDWPFALRDRFVLLPPDKLEAWSHEALLELEAMVP